VKGGGRGHGREQRKRTHEMGAGRWRGGLGYTGTTGPHCCVGGAWVPLGRLPQGCQKLRLGTRPGSLDIPQSLPFLWDFCPTIPRSCKSVGSLVGVGFRAHPTPYPSRYSDHFRSRIPQTSHNRPTNGLLKLSIVSLCRPKGPANLFGMLNMSHITQRYHGSPHRTGQRAQWSGVHVCLRKRACDISQQRTILRTQPKVIKSTNCVHCNRNIAESVSLYFVVLGFTHP